MVGALGCLVATRSRQVLAGTIVVSAVALALAMRLWVSVLGGNRVASVDGVFVVDAFSGFHLVILALVFLICSLFACVYFVNEGGAHSFSVRPARRFGALWLGSLAAMVLVLVSNNLGIMWVGM